MPDEETIIITPLSFAIHLKKDNALFGESSIHLEVHDDAAGPYISIKQLNDPDDEPLKPGVVTLSPEELSAVVNVSRRLIKLNSDS